MHRRAFFQTGASRRDLKVVERLMLRTTERVLRIASVVIQGAFGAHFVGIHTQCDARVVFERSPRLDPFFLRGTASPRKRLHLVYGQFDSICRTNIGAQRKPLG